MKAMLLAAGEGTRLRPVTLATPKPLLEVGGKPLIQHHIEALVRAGITDLVINLHHLPGQMRQFLGDGGRWNTRITCTEEQELLETAGGIINALPLLGPEPFIVVSTDLFTDFDFATLMRPLPAGVLGHLVMVDNPPHHPSGDFAFSNRERGELPLLALAGEPRFNYGGIGLISPALFREQPVARLPLRPLFERAIQEQRLTGERFGGFWINIGTEEHLAAARGQRTAS